MAAAEAEAEEAMSKGSTPPVGCPVYGWRPQQQGRVSADRMTDRSYPETTTTDSSLEKEL